MALAFRSASHTADGTATITPSEPAGAAQNDILFYWHVIGNPSSVITDDLTGWTLLNTWTGSLTITRLYWIRRGASAPDYSITTDSSQYQEASVTCWSGAKTSGNPYGATNYVAAHNATTPPNCGSVTTTAANSLVIAFGMGWNGWVSTNGWTAPSGYSDADSGAGTSINNGDLGVFYKAIASASTSEDPGIFTGMLNGDGGSAPDNNLAEGTVELLVDTGPTAALTGTATSSITETDIVAGGKTVILTLTGDTYVAAAGTPTFSTGTTKGTTAADSAGGGGGRSNNGALTCTFPSGYTPTAGDFAVMIVYSDQGSGSTPAGGWAAVTGSPFGSGTVKLDVFYKVLAGGESDPSTTISGSGTNISHCANMAIYTGVGSIGAVGTSSTGTGTPMTAGAINTTANNSIVMFCAGRGDNEDSGSQTFGGSATGVNERLDGGTASGSDSQVSMADKTIATSGTSSGAGSSTTSATDPWVAVQIELKPSTPFDDARSAIASGLDSAQSEATGWDAKVKPNIPVANVVRTSSTVCTITLQAQADYDISAQETITATIPAAALTGGSPIVASPTFTVDATVVPSVPGSRMMMGIGT